MAGRQRPFSCSPDIPGYIRFRAALLLTCGSLAFCAGQSIHPVILPVVDANDIRFTRVSFGKGPTHGGVTHIVQDDQGFLWFGTQDGVQRYDGTAFSDSPARDALLVNCLWGRLDLQRREYRGWRRRRGFREGVKHEQARS
jgi:hypothetical protein